MHSTKDFYERTNLIITEFSEEDIIVTSIYGTATEPPGAGDSTVIL